MTFRTVTLPADLATRLAALADQQDRSLDELVVELLEPYVSKPEGNWALAVAEGMEAADIDWIDDPDASINSRDHFKRYLEEKFRNANPDSDQDA